MAGGHRIGQRYRLVEPLGTGGMSVVWRGFDEVLERDVAIKLLSPDLAADPWSRESIRREARAAARLSHPYIANVFDFGESTSDDSSPWVVLELVTGAPLSQRLYGGARLPWPRAGVICAQVAAALAEAHHHGVVHRDVKPGNVMVGRAGAKVVDFGISALVGECDLGADGSLLGTPAYVAPERLAGGPAGTAADVYAVGVMLYRVLSGRLPWAVENADQLRGMCRERRSVPLRHLTRFGDIPDDVVRLTGDCLRRDPHQRPASADVARLLAAAAGLSSIPVPAAAAVPVPWSDPAPWPAGVETEPTLVHDPLRQRLTFPGLRFPGLAFPGLRRVCRAFVGPRAPVRGLA
jgi:serine/threonine-protein kinase